MKHKWRNAAFGDGHRCPAVAQERHWLQWPDCAVDDRAKLIVAADLVQDGNDSRQLEPMMTHASEVMESEGLVGLVDAGHCNGDRLKGGAWRCMFPCPTMPFARGRTVVLAVGNFPMIGRLTAMPVRLAGNLSTVVQHAWAGARGIWFIARMPRSAIPVLWLRVLVWVIVVPKISIMLLLW